MRNAAVAVLTALGFGLAVASPHPSMAADAMAAAASPAKDAWLRYRDTFQKEWDRVLNNELSQDPAVKAQGEYLVQSMEAVAFNMYVAPRQQYPALYAQSFYMPFELSWGAPNPDFLYHNGFIDGAHTYRIYGNKRGSFWATLQVLKGFWGDNISGNFTNVDFDDVPEAANGDFEIFLGPNPPAKPEGKYWVNLDPNIHNIYLLMRETFNDWRRDAPMDIHIEILDRDPIAPVDMTEQELAARIDRAAKLTLRTIDLIDEGLAGFRASPSGPFRWNEYVLPSHAHKWGGNPEACYGSILYKIQPDEALIIDTAPSTARYRGIQLSSIWSQTTEYSYHQSSLSGAQAKYDADGRLRAVLALTDPGVPNWLDPVGRNIGRVGFRWYRGKGCDTPKITKVKLAEIRRYLPKDTPAVTLEQRRAELETRRFDSLRRYGQ
jgi:hypothetical protein